MKCTPVTTAQHSNSYLTYLPLLLSCPHNPTQTPISLSLLTSSIRKPLRHFSLPIIYNFVCSLASASPPPAPRTFRLQGLQLQRFGGEFRSAGQGEVLVMEKRIQDDARLQRDAGTGVRVRQTVPTRVAQVGSRHHGRCAGVR